MKKLIAIIAGLALAAGAANAQELANFAFGGPRIVSPEIQGDSVTFRLSANYATVVNLSGSWMPNPWGGSIPMQKGADGVWSVKIALPSPEIYTYNFVVDGVSVNDPQNYMVQRDGTRYLNMLMIPGERTENYFPAEQRGTVSYKSTAMRPARPSIPCSTCCMAAVATRRHGPQWDAQHRFSTT